MRLESATIIPREKNVNLISMYAFIKIGTDIDRKCHITNKINVALRI